MTRIRLVGRTRGGRCVFCHDGLQGDVERCPECRAAWHEDCRPTDGHCHTLGCTAPAPLPSGRAGQVRLVPPASDRPIRDRLDPQPRPDPRWAVQGRQAGRRPGWFARFGPYSRLVLSAVLHSTLLLVVLGALLACLAHPLETWNGLMTDEDGNRSVLLGLFLAVFGVGMGSALTYLSVSWLGELPEVVREVHFLLESTRPVLMDLTIESETSDDSTHYFACLHGRHGEWADQRFRWRLSGLLTPGWVARGEGKRKPVLVYGLPPPGPYILEFENGALALLHPD